MRIKRLELRNFRTFGHAVFESTPDTVVLVSPNGRGKSSILEAIVGAHELVVPYQHDNYDFRETWQQRSVPVWPPHLAPPVKIGERRAEISLEIEAAGAELDYLKAANLSVPYGKAHFVIEDGHHITNLEADPTVRRLFQFHSPNEGIGFIDYIRSTRFYVNHKLGDFSKDLSDDRTKQLFSEFLHPLNHHEKFSTFKSFVVNSQLNDFSHLQATGEQRDSLALFREVFDHFFAPKRFIGYRAQTGGGEPQVVVDSPFGSHDTDSLSDGEKEVLHILAHLYRFRQLRNILLWDTPELHLNAALEARLHDAVRRVAPDNQWWVATHSLEFIDAVPLSSIFVIRQNGNTACVEQASGPDRKTRVVIYQEMGAQVGLQMVSSVVVFVEGKQSHSDKRLLDRLVAPALPGVNFIAGGSCENILSVGTRANELLAAASTNGDFLAVVDRDYRTDEEVEAAVKKYGGRLFIWSVHEIENLFLVPEVVQQTLTYLGKIEKSVTAETIEAEAKAVAASLREWIAADWVAWEFAQSFQPPSRRISGADPRESLKQYADNLRRKVDTATDAQDLERRNGERLAEIDQIIATDKWRERLPGKQILAKFLEKYAPLTPELFLEAAASTILGKSMVVPDLERLKDLLRQAPRTCGKQ